MGNCWFTPFELNKDIEVTGAGTQPVTTTNYVLQELQVGKQYIHPVHRVLKFAYNTDSYSVHVADEQNKVLFELKPGATNGHLTLFKEEDPNFAVQSTPLCYFRWSGYRTSWSCFIPRWSGTNTKGYLCINRISKTTGTSEKLVLATLKKKGRTIDVYIHQDPPVGFRNVNLQGHAPSLQIAAHTFGEGMAFMRNGIKLAEFSDCSPKRSKFADWQLAVGPNVDLAFVVILTEAVRQEIYDEDCNPPTTNF